MHTSPPDNHSRASLRSSTRPLIQDQPSAQNDPHEQDGDTEHAAPQRIRCSKAALGLDLAVDVVLLAISLCFLSLAIASSCFDGKPTQDNKKAADMLTSAKLIGPSLLPIVFAVIVGRACKAIFTWRLERGEQIGTLDLLAGSTSLANTLLTHVALRSFIASVSPILLVIWIISPMGGQASLRVFELQQYNETAPHEYAYLVHNEAYAKHFWSVFSNDKDVAVLDVFFSTALLSPTEVKHGSRDFWFNFKTPMVEAFENKTNTSNDEGWYEVGNANTTVYSSLIGTPLGNVSSEVRYASMNITTSYLRLNCAPLLDHSPNSEEKEVLSSQLSCNSSPSRRSPKREECVLFTLNSEGKDGAEEQGFAMCSAGTTHVELCVECQWGRCAAKRVRRTGPTTPGTYMDEYPGGINNVTRFASSFHVGKRAIAPYIFNPDHPGWGGSPKFNTIPSDVFAVRYGQVLNSAWASLGNYYGIYEEIFQRKSSMTDTIKGSKTTSTKFFTCHWTWMCILVAASLIMILATVVHAALQFIVNAPSQVDITVSSMVRDNRYIHFPMTGSAVDASERARRSKYRRVRYGDVQPYETVGHLAIGSVDEGGGVVERVRYGRYYD